MKIDRIVPILTVTDLTEAIREHTAVLGLEVAMDIGWSPSCATRPGTSSA